MSIYQDQFWGYKNNGFDVLYKSMKCGHIASKEFSEFIKARAAYEDLHSKNLSKFAKQIGTAQGTFFPIWKLLSDLAEKESKNHATLAKQFQDMGAELLKFSEEQHKKQKIVKEELSSTADTVQSIQNITTALFKAEDKYVAKGFEAEKFKKECNGSKEHEKAESAHRKYLDEYRSHVEKHEKIKDIFIKKMSKATERFQEVEEKHIEAMKKYVVSYVEVLEEGQSFDYQATTDFKEQLQQETVEKLLQTFVNEKGTGTEKPESIEMVELDMTNVTSPKNANSEPLRKDEYYHNVIAQIAPPPPSTDMLASKDTKKGFLRRMRKEKKKKKKSDSVNSSTPSTPNTFKRAPSSTSTTVSDWPEQPQIDAEGYSIRPPEPEQRNSFYSSSEDESDEDRPLKFQIKPLTTDTNVGDVDRLKETAQSLILDKSPCLGRRNHTQSINNTPIDNDDILGLYKQPVSSNRMPSPTNEPLSNGTTNSFGGAPTIPPARPLPPSNAAPFLVTNNWSKPWENSNSTSKPQISPVHMPSRARTESIGSVGSTGFASLPLGSSRGPSPLTLGSSETIPIACAITETVNSLFKGGDCSTCNVRICGSLVFSFPSGFVQALTSNKFVDNLSFVLYNSYIVDEVLINKQILQGPEIQGQNHIYQFDMVALGTYLTKLNSSSSFLNVDVLKYQVKVENPLQNVPLQLVSYTKNSPSSTDLRIDYLYNEAAFPSGTVKPLSSVAIMAQVKNCSVSSTQSAPQAIWNAAQQRSVWKLGTLDGTNGSGTLKCKFETNSDSAVVNIAAQFAVEGTTISGLEMELSGPGYRLSLYKKRITTGKYLCED